MLVGIAALVAVIVIAFGLAGSLASPMQGLVETAGRLGRGDLEARSGAISGPRGMRELAGSFDEMAERLERAVRSQWEFVANASHQLRTPLTGMKLRLERAIADAHEDDARESLEAADREVDRMVTIVDRLLLMARRIEEGEATVTLLDDSVRSALDRWEGRATNSGSTLSSTGVPVTAVVNPGDADQVLDVLLDNAISHAPGAIEVETGALKTVRPSSRFVTTDPESRPRSTPVSRSASTEGGA